MPLTEFEKKYKNLLPGGVELATYGFRVNLLNHSAIDPLVRFTSTYSYIWLQLQCVIVLKHFQHKYTEIESMPIIGIFSDFEHDKMSCFQIQCFNGMFRKLNNISFIILNESFSNWNIAGVKNNFILILLCIKLFEFCLNKPYSILWIMTLYVVSYLRLIIRINKEL